jgi:hypothetical protein
VSAPGTVYNLLPKGLNFGELGDVGWMGDAACVGVDPEHFFFDAPRARPRARAYAKPSKATSAMAIAKQKCASCPVTRECLSFALRGSMQNGIFGGLDEREREPLHRTYAALFGKSTTGSGEEFEILLGKDAA